MPQTNASKSKPLQRLTLLLGFLTLALGLVLISIFPSKAELSTGYVTPIIAFEFASSEADLNFLNGSSQHKVNTRHAMRLGLFWDMIFPFAYACFLALLILAFKHSKPTIAISGVFVSCLIIPFDLYENIAMLNVLSALDISADLSVGLGNGQAALAPLLSALHIATWLKWGALGVGIACLSSLQWQNQAPKAALLSAVAAVLVLVTYASGTMPVIAEVMSLSVFVFFLVNFISSVLRFKRQSA